ncbi:circularly permuted type 2 ATP-grasp protein [Marinicrinis sediminis]|uniref:Circularly permuted type 2 ATP-grasp protein n=1 Tax=Marinicrinis sediminis TaxID=1652465 RepID=A0ABW5R7J4_9BACL
MLRNYEVGHFFDEMMLENDRPRSHYEQLYKQLAQFSNFECRHRNELAQQSFLRRGISFTVYNDEKQGMERTMPFDFVPNIIPQEEWCQLEAGLIQRVRALNAFLQDIYTDQQILHDEVVPRQLVVGSPYFCHPVAQKHFVNRNHIFLAGIDLIRDHQGKYFILEDNLRNPSGLSYVFQNRYCMRKVFPEMFQHYAVRALEKQFTYLLSALEEFAPYHKKNPKIVLLTPGIYNSAYFDHSFLAQQMGIDLVEGRDLLVQDRKVYMKTTKGLKQVDVVYRRLDDDYLDPLEFRADSMLGVAGLVDANRAGNVSILNGMGNGVADDKAIYAYVPAMIRYYLNEAPMIDNVQTYLLSDPDERQYVLEHLSELVVKPVDGSGGYNMLIGPEAGEEEMESFRQAIKRRPEAYIAQPTISLSRIPTFVEDEFSGCHVDLRPFVIMGEKPRVIPGGLTRVALKKGSLVVNSSQGGGGKDTWVLEK